MYTSILIATDGSDNAKRAAKEGIELAKDSGAQVLALNVVDELDIATVIKQLGLDRKEVEDRFNIAGQKTVDDIKVMGAIVGISVDPIVRIGSPANVIVNTATEQKADLIVMGKHGDSGLSKLLIGKVVQHVLYWATIPVHVVP